MTTGAHAALPAAAGRSRLWPLLPVVAVVAYDLVMFWPETAVVSYPDDSAMHSEMVRFATARLQGGHFPLNEWFPFLNVGSPHFLHYQSLPAMVAGLAGLVVGPGHAFSWSLFLLLATWPLSVYIGARLLDLPPWAASAAAVLSPFVTSAPGLGFEQGSYLWIGYGLWAQLWAMWLLPLAWGLGWRAVRDGRRYFLTGLVISLTVACHFMTGYLALIPIVFFAVVRPSQWRQRLPRAVLVLVGGVAAAAWVVGPLLQMGPYAAVNEFLQHTSHADSFGARRVLSWLVEGQLFDARRPPVITVLLAVGIGACIAGWRRYERGRVLLALFVMSLVLFFGRPTLGSLLHLLPGSRDLFLRRFVMGVELSGLYIAGLGVTAVAAGLARLTGYARRKASLRAEESGRLEPSRTQRFLASTRAQRFAGGLVACAILAILVVQLGGYDISNARLILNQQVADSTGGRHLDALIARLGRLGPGRVYAGLPVYNWGAHFLVGGVPVYQYLAYRDVDEIGFTLRTASLMSQAEPYFDDHNAGDYLLFGVRYLILPNGWRPLVPAKIVMRSGAYELAVITSAGYVRVVDTRGSLKENRGDIGAVSSSFVRSAAPGDGVYPTVAFNATPPAAPTVRGATPPSPAGTATVTADRLVDGALTARVQANRTAVVVLAASFDPGWTATVDGRTAQVQMVAPALVGVRVGPGSHVVAFRFAGIANYPAWFALSLGALVLLAAVDVLARRRRHRLAPGSKRAAIG